ncbi:hypothetical protein J6590_077185 [Homalodisca vitripennis]|nr:hypothetical protein J6590_077185 [Homalodisca vitripennis]
MFSSVRSADRLGARLSPLRRSRSLTCLPELANECNSDSVEVKCCAGCKQLFHWDCVIDNVEYKKTRSASKEWLCNVCRNSASKAGSVNSAATTTSLTKKFLINVMEQFKKDMFDEMRNFNKEISEVKASLEFQSNAVDTSNTTMKSIRLIEFRHLSETASHHWDNGTLTARNINPAYPANKVYVNEHLSPDNKFLLSSLKKSAKK